MHVKKSNSFTNFYLSDERTAKKPKDHLFKVNQNSQKTGDQLALETPEI